MGYLLDKLDQAKLSNQQDVVRNERRQSIENRPYGIVDEAMFHTLFPKAHPYYADVIGSHADIQAGEARGREEVLQDVLRAEQREPRDRRRHRQGEDEGAGREVFRPAEARARRAEDRGDDAADHGRAARVVTDRVELPRVYMAWITPPIYKPGDADADIAATILGGGKSSRLYKKLVYDKQIAQDVSAQQQSLMLGSVFHDRGDGPAGPHGGGAREGDRRGAGRSSARAARRDGSGARAQHDRDADHRRPRDAGRLRRRRRPPESVQPLPRRRRTISQKDIQRYRAVTPASVKAFANEQLEATARVVVYGGAGREGPRRRRCPTPPAPKARRADGHRIGQRR